MGVQTSVCQELSLMKIYSQTLAATGIFFFNGKFGKEQQQQKTTLKNANITNFTWYVSPVFHTHVAHKSKFYTENFN